MISCPKGRHEPARLPLFKGLHVSCSRNVDSDLEPAPRQLPFVAGFLQGENLWPD